MKKHSYFIGLIGFMFLSIAGFAQKQKTASEDIKVWGNCGMCKKTIETAAKSAGATEANWNEQTKILAVSYNTSKSNNQKIQKAVAAVGYDTQDFTAPDDVYAKLHGCCQYDRKAAAVVPQQTALTGNTVAASAKCCDMAGCGQGSDCCKGMKCCEGKTCAKDMGCCKEGSTCCKNGKCEKGKDGMAMNCCKDANCGKAAGSAVMDCCKDGKCEKGKHTGSAMNAGMQKSCCSKS